ncbi:MAG: response regulator [Taibaiella sp.]|nr:response regulator [Taibaiella sp.]
MKTGIICIVDDDTLIHYTFKKMLESGAPAKKILSFFDCGQLYEYLRVHAQNEKVLPDVILLDLKTPIISGLKFLKQWAVLKPTITKHIVIYVVSSTLNKADIAEAIADPNVSGYLPKPLRWADMRNMIADESESA